MGWAAKRAGIVAIATLAICAVLGLDPERSGSLMVTVGISALLLLCVYERSRR